MAELRKSHSNYILRKKRQLTAKGSLYERDWMTVSELDGFAPGTLPVYASGNFKMSVNNERLGKKRYSFSNWLMNDSGNTEWTLNDIVDEQIKLNKALIKPNYSSILDFAYYGSAVELIRATANDLIERFPGELYTTVPDDGEYSLVTGASLQTLDKIVENPFSIDIWSEYVKPENVKNPLRYMCLSWDKYEIVDGDNAEPVKLWLPGNIHKSKCFKDGDVVFDNAKICGSGSCITFKGIYFYGKTVIVYEGNNGGKHIRLQKKYEDEVFDSFDDFEKVLLNRDTIPMFKAKFYTPKETEKGVITYERSYVWPTMNGNWNIDMESASYASYLESLLYIANYYDEIRTDNIWRSYTHESIKNFDWTTPKDTYVPEIDGDLIDTERLEAIMRVCGRQFDDIKRYIENIKFTTNISYDSKNNMPDDDMTKFLEMNGWEVKNVAPSNDNGLIHDEVYPGKHVKYNPEDVNNEFLKRMILNSRSILSKKGTRAGIEEMYSMFGIFDIKYGETMNYCGSAQTIGFTIDEYDVFADGYISGSDVDLVYNINKEKNQYETSFEKVLYDYPGLMVDEKFEVGGIRYLVPWYDADYEYDGRPYYQMMGGWGKRHRKNVMVPFADIAEIFSDENFSIYDETVKNIKVVDDLRTLNDTPIGFLNEGDVYYVLNMNGAPDCELEGDSGYSHYVLFTSDPSDFSGSTYPYDEEHVWCLISNSEFNVPTEDLSWYAKKIIYMESIHDVQDGNNPHDGKGLYDDGRSYFDYYRQIFKGTFDNDMFSEYRARISNENARRNYENRFRVDVLPPLEDNTSAVTDVGFELIGVDDSGYTIPDNSKIWFFLSQDNGIYPTSEYSGSTLYTRAFEEGDFSLIDETYYPLKYEDKQFQNAPIRDTGSTITVSGDTLDIPVGVQDITQEITQYGPDATWSYSVINTKKLKITYYLPWEMEDYVTDVVEFYVKQLIPSTVITEFVWNYTGGGVRPPAKVPYTRLTLSPSFQRLRSYESETDITIDKVNVDNVEIAKEIVE